MKTVETLKQIDEHIFVLDYVDDYDLQGMLDKGIGNAAVYLLSLQHQLGGLMRAADSLARRTLLHGGCTTFNAQTPGGDSIFARNFDYKEAPCVAVWTHPRNGYASVGVTDSNFMLLGRKHRYPAKVRRPLSLLAAPYVTMDGVNEKGLAVAVLEVKAKPTCQRTGKPAITTPLIIRAVLDKCATVDEAIELFRQYDMHSSFWVDYHFQIADSSGASVLIEYIDNEMKVLRAGECPQYPDKWQYALNFYMSEGGDNRKGVGYTRQKQILASMSRCTGVMSEDEAMQLLSDCRLTYRNKWLRHMVISCWSAVYNLDERSMLLCGGMDYDRKYRLYVDRPGVVERVE